jgi:hypothetical protein
LGDFAPPISGFAKEFLMQKTKINESLYSDGMITAVGSKY